MKEKEERINDFWNLEIFNKHVEYCSAAKKNERKRMKNWNYLETEIAYK